MKEFNKNLESIYAKGLYATGEVLDVDFNSKSIIVKDIVNNDTFTDKYDKLMIATGARNFIPPIKNIELKNESSLRGVGDDCAVLAFDGEKEILVTTDMLMEGVHFDLTYMSLKHLGYKSAIVNFSDITSLHVKSSIKYNVYDF